MSVEFDPEVARVRADHITRLLEAHNVPDDRETAIVLLVESIGRLVKLYGPTHMPDVTRLFVLAWRHMESAVVMQGLIHSVLEEAMKHVANMGLDDDGKVH